jgi:hypothetical protein
VLHIHEVTGMADNNYLMQELFRYDPTRQEFMQTELKPHNPKLQRQLQAEESQTAPFVASRYVI